jgi:alkylhydroperoxidase family enzyme
MAFINYVGETEATDETRAAYARHRNCHGGVDNILRIHGANPATMGAHSELYRSLMFAPSPLTRTQREMLALVVSAANSCHY